MLIGQDPNRWKRFMVSFVLFLIVAGMVMSNSMILQVLDSVFQALLAPNPNHTPNATYHIMVVVSFFGQPQDGPCLDADHYLLSLGLQI